MVGFSALFAHFPLRLALYAGLEAAALQGIVVTGVTHGPELFKEDGPIEWTSRLLRRAQLFFSGGLTPERRRTPRCSLL